MNPNEQSSASGLKLDDIYYVIFRHKWKIAMFAAIGLIAAAALYFATPPVYVSEAKLLIRYVLESKGISPMGADDQVKSPDARGENIINSELEILSSFDLAREVVKTVGADKILAKSGGGNSPEKAAAAVRRGVTVEVPRNSNIIRVMFAHRDPGVVQPVLKALVDVYRRKHIEIHRGLGLVDDFLSQQTDKLRADLAQTERDLRAAKAKADVISVEDSKKAFVAELTKLRQDLFAAEAELEERKAALAFSGTAATDSGKTNAVESAILPDQINAYRDVCSQLNSLTTNRLALLAKFRDDSALVKQVTEEIARLEIKKKQLETDQPKLLTSGIATVAAVTGALDVLAEMARVRALEARLNVLNNHLVKVRADIAKLDQAETDIVRLNRQKELEESNYKHYSSNLEQARADETLGVGKITNISTVQEPTPPALDASKIMKPVGGAAAGGIAFGLALAFFLELILNHSIRRPSEIENKVHLPLFLTIPDSSPRRRELPAARFLRRVPVVRKLFPITSHELPITDSASEITNSQFSITNLQLPSAYSDALRDRLMTWFDARNLTHKPKLVAITSCSKSAGVSTVASGLAASLSEMGSGNVLLVDMDHDRAATHPFLNGKPACALHDALEESRPETSLVQQNLYVASGNGAPDSLSKAIPRRFAQLMPKMKASNYDYIIFDMPPINQTSITPRVANHMDLVLIVVEAEQTSREAVTRGLSALQESKAEVAAVMNKTRSYVPSWLQHEDI